MDLRTVGQFIAIAEEGTLRGAAQRLGLSQPALTKSLRRLEDELGAQLVERSASGSRLTPSGEAFLRHARALRITHDGAMSELRAIRAGHGGVLRIGAGPAWQRRILPAAIEAFRRSHPEVRLAVAFGSDGSLKAFLREGRIDVVLAALPDGVSEPDLGYTPLVRGDYRVLAGAGHPLAGRPAVPLADLLGFPWLLSGSGTLIAERIGAVFRAQGLPAPEPAVETEVSELKRELMHRGPYLTCNVGDALEASERDRLVVIDTATPLGSRAAGVMVRIGAGPYAASRAFVDVLRCVVREMPAPGQG